MRSFAPQWAQKITADEDTVARPEDASLGAEGFATLFVTTGSADLTNEVGTDARVETVLLSMQTLSCFSIRAGANRRPQ